MKRLECFYADEEFLRSADGGDDYEQSVFDAC
jgi:hypothetical protein